MSRISHEQFKTIELSAYAAELRQECYLPLEKLCHIAQNQVRKLEGLELQVVTSQYTNLCNNLITEIIHCLKTREDVYIPYTQSLAEKVVAEHNCSECSGNCKVNHDMQLFELKASQNSIANIIKRLNIVSLPLYSDTIYPDTYRVLRNQMALIENMLTELLFLEKQYLIPKITEAQKNINAGS